MYYIDCVDSLSQRVQKFKALWLISTCVEAHVLQWRWEGGHGGAAPPPNDFWNRLLYSSKFDEKEACGGEGGG